MDNSSPPLSSPSSIISQLFLFFTLASSLLSLSSPGISSHLVALTELHLVSQQRLSYQRSHTVCAPPCFQLLLTFNNPPGGRGALFHSHTFTDLTWGKAQEKRRAFMFHVDEQTTKRAAQPLPFGSDACYVTDVVWLNFLFLSVKLSKPHISSERMQSIRRQFCSTKTKTIRLNLHWDRGR